MKDESQPGSRRFLWGAAPLFLYIGVLFGLFVLESGWAAILGYHLAICGVLFLASGWSEARSLIHGWKKGGYGLGMIGLCVVSGVLVYALWPIICLPGEPLSDGLESVGLVGWSWYLFIAYYSLVNPWLEELFWRGWYPKQLRRPIISDVLFAGYHVLVLVLFIKVPWTLLAFVVLFAAAFIWRFLARNQRGLLIPVVSHLVADVSVIVAAHLLAR